jgi:hypothetical protein
VRHIIFVLTFFFFAALLSQTNPNWIAYFFVTDDRPFDGRLQEILAQRSDSRLRYVNIDPAPRLKVSIFEAENVLSF